MRIFKTCLAAVVAIAMATGTSAADGKGKIEGKVLGKDGAGVSGANVRLVVPKEKGDRKNKDKAAPAAAGDKENRKENRKNKANDGKRKPVAKAMSEAGGAFAMSDVPAGEYVVMARTKEGLNAHEKVTVKTNETATVELKLSDKKPVDKKGKKKKENK